MSEKIKIAIADDHSLVREALKKQLEGFGFEVIIEAANGQDLLDQIALEKRSVNLCILDVNMPLMNGIETAYSIKSKWPAIKIIGYSLEESNREIMINKGADAFLLKDCNSEVMSKTILEIMSK